MRLQVLSSGSEGNSTLLRCGETTLLVDAGLPRDEQIERIEKAGVPLAHVHHVLVTHGHLDHARSAGSVARRSKGYLHCPENILSHASTRKARRVSVVGVDRPFEVTDPEGRDAVRVRPVGLPHDCDPTVAFLFEHEGRRAAIVTDLGQPSRDVALGLANAHVLVLEFNYDPDRMRSGPYPFTLQRRITGGRGHLSNAQGGAMLELLVSEHLHTLVLAHLSKKTNAPELALEAATAVIERLGLASRVRIVIASQDELGEAIEV